ncbi:PREDICTED: uncharacterized protein LOC109174772 [Ipomoea nil]|uniref:uncharacterized protein LOC109174772 n=1 Tax=Ipomoea nil TaxID=35883 RepID=UPI0009008A34|nr:PREDICTED: uncharacterized protein LOC109174772 [Ipomoea nil]
MKHHLAGTKKNVKPCDNVSTEVKQKFVDILNKVQASKNLAQMEFEQRVDVGSYFGSGREVEGDDGNNVVSGVSGSGSISTRGIRGPMDRFMMKESSSGDQPTTITPQNAKELRNQVCLDIGRFFYENAIPFNVARSPSFVNMLRSVGAYGWGFKPPSMYNLRTWILKEELTTTTKIVDDIKSTWPLTGVSIMSDGWQDIRYRSLINFLVNNPSGTVFLKCVDASEHVKDAKLLFRLLDEVVEEVGEELVVQVITDNASNYRAAGQMLMEKRKHLYWTPCVAHCLDLMLEKIGELPQDKNALIKAKKVSNYIHNHSWVLSLMRQFTNRELIRPAATRFATAYLTLQSIYQVRQPLEAMFTSEKWTNSNYTTKLMGRKLEE